MWVDPNDLHLWLPAIYKAFKSLKPGRPMWWGLVTWYGDLNAGIQDLGRYGPDDVVEFN
jgi:hypothetical protein